MIYGRLLMTVLLCVVLIAALVSFVFKQNETRKVFAESQRIELKALELNAEWARLQLEKSTLVANNRIESVAKKQLGMSLPDDEQIMVIKR
ncbi:MAG: cell division protein FtsL [Proteobacteria bacterium]|nr:cell division protein FtsL [Pseudomonadota bacterium]